MNVKINGESSETDCSSLAQLVASLVDKPNGLIVEINGEVIKHDQWEKQAINEGDSIELIKFVGGG